jgi:multidrug efflux system membrane fusion protein
MKAATTCEVMFRQAGARFLKYAVLLMIPALLAACGDKKPKPMPPRVTPVTDAFVVQKDIPVQLTAIGNVEPYSTVAVTSRIAGQLVKVHFKEGQDVKKGDMLFTIDPRPFEAALRQAEGNLARDKAQMENAYVQARRYEELIKKGYVAQSDYDQLRTSADALAAVVGSDKAAVENAHLQVGYCRIYSPITGRTGTLLLNEGSMIKENDKTIVTINQVQPIYVGFSLPEQSLPEVKKYSVKGGLKVSVKLPHDEEKPETGTLTFVDNAVDRTTGTIRLKATFENSLRKLWPGQFVDVVVGLTTQPNALVVPSQAVMTGQQGQYVFVIKPDSSVDMRPVVVNRTLDNDSVVEKGLNAGERVVTDGQLRLVPGAKVESKTKTQPAAGKGAVK